MNQRVGTLERPTTTRSHWTDQRGFLLLTAAAITICALTYRTPHLAMWVGFTLAAYSVIANDSIQTIGTFLSSNARAPWWVLWLFIGGIFAATVGYSWLNYGGDISYGRLASKGFETAPTQFTFLQVAAPLALLILTRFRVPVSTTLLILSGFSSKGKSVGKIVIKSLSGYGVAFASAIAGWLGLGKVAQHRVFKRFRRAETPSPIWRLLQWGTSGALWSIWLMQDAANIAVFLPRQLSVGAFVTVLTIVLTGLAVLLYFKGGRIQSIVQEKRDVNDVRSATSIDSIYAAVLYYFKIKSRIPMSTTWVFLGLLGGREVAMSGAQGTLAKDFPKVRRILVKDVSFALLGLIVSLVLAAMVNPVVRQALFG